MAATWAETARGDDPATIGRPLPGYRVYILDGERRPVATGVEGELYIGGPAVARGYRNRPDLTNERFSLDPFPPDRTPMYPSPHIPRPLPARHIDYPAP